MASMAASLGAQMPRSVINPVTKRWGYVKDVSNSFTIECCSLICSMCSHNPTPQPFNRLRLRCSRAMASLTSSSIIYTSI